MSSQIERISLTIPEELVSELDVIVESSEYGSRSKAVRDSIRQFITDYSWHHEPSQIFHGSVTIVYDHEQSGINDVLIELQHDVNELIISTQHVHFDHDLCLETLVVSGTGAEIRNFVNELKAIKGMKQVQVTAV